jgi:hypothetical protein
LHNVNALTIDAWFKPVVVTTGVRTIAAQYVDANAQVALAISSNIIKFCVGNDITITAANSTAIEANKVYHITGFWDRTSEGGKVSLCVNGTRFNSTRMITTATNANDEMYIGAYDGSSNQLNGTLYTLAIYYEKLSMAQIASITARDQVLNEIVDHFWLLNEGSGTTFEEWTATNWWPIESWTMNLLTDNSTWHAIEDWSLDLIGSVKAWLRIELWAIDLLAHSWIPSSVQDPYFFIFLGAAIGAMACLTITLLRVKARDVMGAGTMLVLTIVLVGVMVGVLLA